MGVQGLWDVLSKAGESRSLTHLAVADGFENNQSGRRALRVGIDASLWYQHAQFSKGGKNPELRMLFFRVLNLLELPIIPLFVFDGQARPKLKRGSRMGKSGSHALTEKLKQMLNVFGVEWRMAHGEAEAELAFLNRVGVIDAIMTDDADALVFGAKMIIRNTSLTLTGHRSDPAVDSEGKASKHHVKVFRADDIRNHPDIGLTRGGMVLFALLSGGDYASGVRRCGPQIAHALTRCGFGDQLVEAYDNMGPTQMKAWLPRWRAEMNHELHTNSRGYLSHRCPSVLIPDDFPNVQILVNYACPITSEASNRSGGALRDKQVLSISGLAGFCEGHFDEWGYRSKIVDRFRDLVWKAALVSLLRYAALEADEKEKTRRIAAGRKDMAIRGVLSPSVTEAIGTPAALVQRYLDPAISTREDLLASAFVNKGPQPGPSRSGPIPDTHPLITGIVGFREHKSTDNLPEYRVELNPKQFIDLANKGIKGKHPDLGETRNLKIPRPKPLDTMKLWIPASMMKQVHPRLVQEYETALAEKASGAKATGKRKGKARATHAEEDSDDDDDDDEHMASGCQPSASSQKSSRNPPVNSASPTTSPHGNTTRRGGSQSRSRIEIPINSSSSLPQRRCGFLFTFPNPDNPDFVMSEEDDDGTLPTDHNTTQLAASAHLISEVTSSSAPARTQRRARHSAPLPAPSDGAHEDAGPELRESVLKRVTDAYIDSILNGTAKKRNPKPPKPPKRARRSLPEAEATMPGQRQEARKRQKTNQVERSRESEPKASVGHTNNPRAIASFPDLPPLDNPSIRQYRTSSDLQVSDNADGLTAAVGKRPARKGAAEGKDSLPKRRIYVPPTSSQDSRPREGFLGDVDVMIDLT